MSNLKLPACSSFADADRILAGKDSRRIGYQTWLIRGDGIIAVRHHRTLIVRYYPTGAVMVNCNGYRSRTTLFRVRHFTNAHIYQRAYSWRVRPCGWDGAEIDYFDGIMFDASGALIPAETITGAALAA